MQFRFASIEKLPEPPQIHLVKGNFVHRVLELLLAHEPELRTVDAAREDFELAKAEYEPSARFVALGLSQEDREAFFKDSRELVNGYYRMENPRNTKVIGLEMRLEVDVTDESNAACDAAAIKTFDQIAESCQTGEFETHRSGLCNFCAFKQWCPEFGGDPTQAQIQAPMLYPALEKN